MWHIINQQLTRLVDLFLPAQCALCGLKIDKLSESRLVCHFCFSALIKDRPSCQHCALPLPTYQDYCGDCIGKEYVFSHIHAVADYTPPYSSLIKKFKYSEQLLNGEVLGALLLQSILRNFSSSQIRAIDYLVAVPLHPKKQRARGFNQALLLAKVLSTSLNIPLLTNGIERKKETVPQEGLTIKERHSNLQDAFCFNQNLLPKLKGKQIVLIDDVVTTGATANSFCQQLLDQKIEKVDIWCICRTSLKV